MKCRAEEKSATDLQLSDELYPAYGSHKLAIATKSAAID